MRSLLVFVLLISSTALLGQRGDDTRSWEIDAQFGFVIAHRPEVRNLQIDHARGLTLKRFWQTSGKLQWHQSYHFPKVGLELQYFDTGNLPQLGFHASCNAFVHLPLGRNTPFYQQLGLGLGFTNKPWNIENNVKGIMLGSHINSSMMLTTGADFRLTKSWVLTTGIKISHFSNAAFNLPNLGTNTASIFLGVKRDKPYRFNNPGFDHAGNIRDPIGRARHQWIALLTAGAKGIEVNSKKKYPTAGLSLFYKQRGSEKVFWIAGADLMYNRGASFSTATYQDGKLTGEADPLRVGAKVGGGLILDALSLHIELGRYIYNDVPLDGDWYHRLQLSHHWGPALYSTLGLKTHYFRADHIEIGLGYRLFVSNAQI